MSYLHIIIVSVINTTASYLFINLNKLTMEVTYVNIYRYNVSGKNSLVSVATQQAQDICKTFVQCWTNIEDVGVIVEELIQSRGIFCMMLSHPPSCLKGIPISNLIQLGI